MPKPSGPVTLGDVIIDLEDKKRFPLLVKFVCMETSLVLDEEEPEPSLVGTCFMLLEFIIEGMANDEEQTTFLKDVSPDMVISLCNSLKETVQCVCNFFKSLAQRWDSIREDEDKVSILVGCVRLMCLWADGDPSSLGEDLPDLVFHFDKLIEDEKTRLVVGPFLATSFMNHEILGAKLNEYGFSKS